MNLLSDDPELERQVTERLTEVLQRISDLEESKRQKDIEISVLRHALENVFRTIDLYKEKLKKLPKSRGDQTSTCG